MTNTLPLFNGAELAFAAYATLAQGQTADGIAQLQATGFSSKQANEFATRYPTIIAQFNDNLTSFSATVFRDAAQNVTLAIRGTQEAGDFIPTDAHIATLGAGYDQIVAMVNWWARGTTAQGQMAQQFRINSYPNGVTPPAGAVPLYTAADGGLVYLEQALPAAATGNLIAALNADPDQRIDVTGHSLGAHLALAFNALFPSRTSKVTAYNTPGFINNSTNQQFFSALGGSVPTAANSANVTNVFADESNIGQAPWLAIAGLHNPPGTTLLVPIENQWLSDEPNAPGALNHSQMILSDSLALFHLMSQLAPALSLEDYKSILNRSVVGTAGSYERIVDGLNGVFGINAALLKKGNGSANRDALYQSIYGLQANAEFIASVGHLQILPIGTSSNVLANLAINGDLDAIAYRYALQSLNPFVAVGRPGLYNALNQDGRLSLFVDSATTPGGMTSEFINDRAQMLAFLMTGNTNETTAFASNQVNDQVFYQDLSRRSDGSVTDLNVFLPGGTPNPRGPNTRVIAFGTERADSLQGRENTDRLYGGRGTDYLRGGKSNDYLEGGRGADVYDYAASRGLLGSNPQNDGNDEIRDTDGVGVLRYSYRDGLTADFKSTVIADASVNVNATTWTSADQNFRYEKLGADLRVTIVGDAGGTLLLRGFKDGDFGIRLADATTVPQNPVRRFIGDKQNFDFDPNQDGIQAHADEFGNFIRADGQGGRNDVPLDNRADTFLGSANNELESFATAGGDDTVLADGLTGATGGADQVDAGAGRDIVWTGLGNDFLEGGADGQQTSGFPAGDVLNAGSEDDVLFGNSRIDFGVAIAQGETDTSLNAKGDFLSGAGGKDRLVGASENDLLLGGGDRDIIVGGAGDDTIYGDLGYSTNTLDWTAVRSVQVQNGQRIYTVDFTGMLIDDTSAGGGDSIYGGKGADWVFAGDGDDFFDGGSGEDVAFGGAGSDILLGGVGNDKDVLVGDDPGVVTGAAEGGDYLDGGGGDDELFGTGGDDVLVGGTGNDLLVGGTGRDIYLFNKGDGTDTIIDTPEDPANPEGSILILGEGFSRGDIKFRTGSLLVDVGGGEGIHLEGFNFLDPQSTPILDELRFADGDSMSYADILAQGFDIDGTEDDDNNTAHPQIQGTGVTDRIRGLGGNDFLLGLAGNDSLDGGTGNDQLQGGNGSDVLDGGADSDVLFGEAGDDTLRGGDGSLDQLLGGDGNDTLFGEAGTDHLFGEAGDDTLDGGSGNDFLIGNLGNDTLSGGDDGDNLHGQRGADVIDGGAGNDFLYGDGVYDVLGTPTLNFDDDGAADTLRGGDGNDYLNAAGGNDVLEGGAGDDRLEAEAGDDTLDGGDGVDILLGAAGNDTLLAGAGDDSFVQGGAGADTLNGGAGNDVLEGQTGDDLYLFNLGDQRDRIFEDTDTVGDRVRFGAGIVLGDLTFAKSNAQLVISHINGTDALTIENWYAGTGFRVAQFEFDGGTILTGADATNRGLQNQVGTAGNDSIFGTSGNDVLNGLGGNDSISGQGGNDLIIGGTGNDTLNTGAGNDTYQFAPGDGTDTIIDNGGFADSLIFGAGVTKSQFTPSRALNGDLVLTGPGTDKVTIQGWFTNLNNKIESITFAGTGEAFTDAETIAPFLSLTGTAAGDSINGGVYDETITGLGGNDFISAGGGNDVITGGLGNDTMNGGAGLDRYFFLAGDGQDVITDDFSFTNVLRFGPGLVNNVVFGSIGNDGLITFTGSTDSVRITNGSRLKSEFEINLTSNADTFTGTNLNEVIQGLGGADSINGGNGADEIHGGDGNDLLEGGGSLISNESDSDTLFGGAGDDILDGGIRTDTADVGSSFTGGAGNDQLFGGSGTDFYFFNLGDGNDIITDESLFANGHNIFSPEDSVFFGPGITKDTIGARYSGADIIVQVTPTDSVTLKNWTSVLTRVDFLRFADGSFMNDFAIDALARTITGTSGNDTLTGTTGNDTMRGLSGDDTINADSGNDTVTGGTGNDVIDGGSGNDRFIFASGDGQDRITDAAGTDTLEFGAGISAGNVTLGRSANDLLLTLAGGAGSVTITNYLIDPARRIENFQFADASALPDAATIVDSLVNIRGTAGNDTLTGTAGFDILSGFDGDDDISSLGDNDQVLGGLGADTYRFNTGDGADLIVDPDGGNRVLFGAGITPANLATARSGNNLVLSVTGTSNQLTVQDWMTSFQVSEFRFSDNTVWDVQTIKNRLLTGTAGNDVLVGFSSDDTISGLDGNDQLSGGGGNDIVDGGNGSDALSGNDGDDVLIAGDTDAKGVLNTLDGGNGVDLLFGSAFNDQMVDGSGNTLFDGRGGDDQMAGTDANDLYAGGLGNDAIDGDAGFVNGIIGSDVVLFNRADGDDTVARLGSAKALSLGGLTSYTQIKLSRSGNQLAINLGKNSITFSDWYGGTSVSSRPEYLQVMAEGLRKYNPASADPTLNRKVVLFNLQGFIGAFDAAQAAGDRFVAADHLPQYFVSGSDTEAYGGALAYQYGTTGTLGALSAAEQKAVVAAPEFGAQLQSIGAPVGAGAASRFAESQEEVESTEAAPLMMMASTQEAPSGAGTGSGGGTAPAAAGDTGTAAAPSHSAPASANADTPRDPLNDKLQSLIDSWFAEARDRQPGLSHYADIREGLLLKGSTQASESALRNALQWSALREGLARNHELYDAGLDLGSDWLRSAGGLMTGALASGNVGLASPPGQELKVLKGLSEGLVKLG
jgi:Ca2+-binding RTX toxin-like protein